MSKSAHHWGIAGGSSVCMWNIPLFLAVKAAFHPVVPRYSLSIFCADGQLGGLRVRPKQCWHLCWLIRFVYTCVPMFTMLFICAFWTCRQNVMPQHADTVYDVASSHVSQIPSLLICQASILHSAAGHMLSFLSVRHKKLSLHILAGPQAHLKNKQPLCFCRQTSWYNDDSSYWRAIKRRQRCLFKKEHNMKHQKLSSRITLQLLSLNSVRLCQAITDKMRGKITIPQQACTSLQSVSELFSSSAVSG